jgi:hypothetical protein
MKFIVGLVLFVLSCCCAFAQETPMFSISGGWVYMNADQHDAGRTHYNGWYAIPEYHIGKG